MEKSKFDKLLEKCTKEEDVRYLMKLYYKDKKINRIVTSIFEIILVVGVTIIMVKKCG